MQTSEITLCHFLLYHCTIFYPFYIVELKPELLAEQRGNPAGYSVDSVQISSLLSSFVRIEYFQRMARATYDACRQ
jgi:hypothetical protein